MRHLWSYAMGIAIAVTLPLAAVAQPVDLTILHTNDTHDHLVPYDTRKGHQLGGIARRATLIARLRAQHQRVLVLDAGDTFQGTPLFNFFSGAADYDSLDQAGYDATTVGNHDLDNGLENLKRQASGRHFSMISSNVLDPKTGQPIFMGERLFTLNGLKVGVFGVMGDDALAAVAMKNQQGFTFAPPVETAQRMANELRQKADLVVMLSHSGLDQDLDLARHVTGIDVIVGGHSHTKVDHPKEVMNGTWKTLVLQAFQWGEYLGELDLKVDHGHIVSYQGNLLPITREIPEAPEVAKTVSRYQSQIDERMGAVIGAAPMGLSGEGKYGHDSELGNWTSDVMRTMASADIGVMNAGGLRASLQPGPVTVGSVFTIFPFDNALVTLDLDGATLQQILDRAAASQHEAGMLQYSNLTFRVADGHAVEAKVGGAPLDPARRYKVATIDYIAQGNDKHTLFTKGTNYQAMGVLLRDAILSEIKAHPTVMPPAVGRIQLQ